MRAERLCMNNLKELQSIANKFSILYVEDNEPLRMKATQFLRKFFKSVVVASNGEEGLSLFKKDYYPIVITDIKMPKMDGMSMISHIKKMSPSTKSIVMSAFDDKELLMQGIELGVFRFLKKPVNITELADVLYGALSEIKHEYNMKLFHMHLQSVFEYQSSMICMFHNSKIILANDAFLGFFHYESTQECQEKMKDIGEFFLKHEGFLYNTASINSLEYLRFNTDKLFHIKMKKDANDMRHFIVKYHEIPEKNDYGILSFDDITELNLLELFDAKQTDKDKSLATETEMFNLLEVVQRNSAKVEMHNYYKGLSITNNGVITEIKDGTITLKTSYMQQKAVQIEQKTLIVSTALPFSIEANLVHAINFEKQTVVLGELQFVKTSPITRKTIRVTVDSKQTVSLFIGENKFSGEISIADISLDAVKLELNALPAGLEKGSEVRLDIVLELDKKPLIINTKATLFRKSESRHSFSVVFMFKELKKSALVKYITKRQMELIREIKGMQNG